MTNNEIAPNVLNEALRNVRSSASNGNTRGFMLAYTGIAGVGFNFLARQDGIFVAFHATPHAADFLKYSCESQEVREGDFSFFERYLQTAAANMQADYARLVRHFASRNSDWRFVPWEHGKYGGSRDNDPEWRQKLWPWVKRIVNVPPTCVNALPKNACHALLTQLRGHATEGMIVLDR